MTKLFLFLVVLCLFSFRTAYASTDVTAQVRAETNLERRIAEACNRYCWGNRREGRLEHIFVSRRDARNFLVQARARLRSRDRRMGVTVASNTMYVNASGNLNSSTCNLQIEDLNLEGDYLGLETFIRRERGKVHHIENCRRFLRGL